MADQTKLSSEGSKKFFWRPPPPPRLSKGLDVRPHPLLFQGLDPGTAMNLHSFVAAIHARIIIRSLEIQISGK